MSEVVGVLVVEPYVVVSCRERLVDRPLRLFFVDLLRRLQRFVVSGEIQVVRAFKMRVYQLPYPLVAFAPDIFRVCSYVSCYVSFALSSVFVYDLLRERAWRKESWREPVCSRRQVFGSFRVQHYRAQEDGWLPSWILVGIRPAAFRRDQSGHEVHWIL